MYIRMHACVSVGGTHTPARMMKLDDYGNVSSALYTSVAMFAGVL